MEQENKTNKQEKQKEKIKEYIVYVIAIPLIVLFALWFIDRNLDPLLHDSITPSFIKRNNDFDKERGGVSSIENQFYAKPRNCIVQIYNPFNERYEYCSNERCSNYTPDRSNAERYTCDFAKKYAIEDLTKAHGHIEGFSVRVIDISGD